MGLNLYHIFGQNSEIVSCHCPCVSTIKFVVNAKKNSIPKTLYLCHHPSTRTTCMSELKNVLACNGDGHGDGHGHGNGNGDGDGSGDGDGNGDGDSDGDGGGKGNGNMQCH